MGRHMTARLPASLLVRPSLETRYPCSFLFSFHTQASQPNSNLAITSIKIKQTIKSIAKMEAKRPEIPSADEVPDKPTDCEESSVLATPANSAASAATPEISKLPIPAGLATSDLTTSLADLTTSLTDLSTYLADLATSLGSLKKALAETAGKHRLS